MLAIAVVGLLVGMEEVLVLEDLEVHSCILDCIPEVVEVDTLGYILAVVGVDNLGCIPEEVDTEYILEEVVGHTR